MTFTINTDNLENNNFQLTENESGDLVLTHKSTGATFDYDSTNEQWIASDGIKTPALEADGLRSGAYFQASFFDGATPTDRLESAISNSSFGDAILLEKAEYDQNLTIETRRHLIGVGSNGGASTRLQAEWTITANETRLHGLRVESPATITFNVDRGTIENLNVVSGDGLIINGNNNIISVISFADILFESGTNDNIVDTATGVSVTDNGANTVGDIA